jgi:hypothetical protein
MGNLSAQGVKNAGPGKYEDGDGLRLVVSATGAKKWVLRITVAGKRREMGLGSYPLISLAEAREKALEARKSVVKGQDPIATTEGGDGGGSDHRKCPPLPKWQHGTFGHTVMVGVTSNMHANGAPPSRPMLALPWVTGHQHHQYRRSIEGSDTDLEEKDGDGQTGAGTHGEHL